MPTESFTFKFPATTADGQRPKDVNVCIVQAGNFQSATVQAIKDATPNLMSQRTDGAFELKLSLEHGRYNFLFQVGDSFVTSPSHSTTAVADGTRINFIELPVIKKQQFSEKNLDRIPLLDESEAQAQSGGCSSCSSCCNGCTIL